MAFVYKADPARGVAWGPPADIKGTFPNLEILFSFGAGVDQFDLSRLPPALPVVRMIEPGIEAGMVEYVTLSVLALHRDFPLYRSQQAQQVWRAVRFPLAARRRVGVMGLGVLSRPRSTTARFPPPSCT